jgi:LMBR1 domain-containing protein 1
MALIQSTLIWIVYAVVLVLLVGIASTFVYVYQAPRERTASVTIVCIVTLTSLLATVLLLPVDIALISSTTSSKLGRRKDWATDDRVDNIIYTLKIVYYTLYSLDAVLCLLVIPFTYFWYEEYDEVATEEGSQTFGSRLWGAFKYTIGFIALVIALFLIGFFVPVAKDRRGGHYDLDYFRRILEENRKVLEPIPLESRLTIDILDGERALTFGVGLLITIGTLIYVLYTGAGMALLPVALIKTAPAVSAPTLGANAASALEENRERQRQLELRNAGANGGLNPKDRRELDALVREERTLVRRERLAAEASGEGQGWILRTWTKIEAIFRPLKLIGGILLMLLAISVWVSMLLTGIDKAKNSVCKSHCGYILGYANIFNPFNWIFVTASKVFPVDYVLYLLLVLFFFSSSVVGIAAIGIRFLWLKIFAIRKGHTSPQALLMGTVMLTLISLATSYSLAMMVAPQYTHFGPQTFCDRPLRHPTDQPDCSTNQNRIRPCSEASTSQAAANVCTPSVGSRFLDRITVNFSFFGAITFWAQFFFLGMHWLFSFIVTWLSIPRTAKV